MADKWVEVDEGDAIRALGAPVIGDVPDSALSLLMAEPATRRFLRSESSLVSGRGAGSMSYLIPRTRVFVNRERAKDLRGDVYAAGAVWALSQSFTWSAAVAAFRKLVQTVKVLNDDELDVLAIIAGIGASAGSVAPVPTERIAAAYEDGKLGLAELLESLRRRGVLARDSAGWLIVP